MPLKWKALLQKKKQRTGGKVLNQFDSKFHFEGLAESVIDAL